MLIFSLVMVLCYLLGWCTQHNLIMNASNPGLATLIFIMLIAEALSKTSLLQKLKRILFGKNERRTLIRVIGISALSSAFLNNTAVSAVLINAIKSTKLYFPSRLLLPMSFATIMGGTLTLIGTSTNLIVNSMYSSEKGQTFSFFAFTPIGIVVTLVGCITLYFTSLLLPKIRVGGKKKEGYCIEVELSQDSSLVGLKVGDAGIRHLEGLSLIGVVRKGSNKMINIRATTALKPHDKLIFIGDISKISVLSQVKGLTIYAIEKGFGTTELVEVIVKESSPLIGKMIKNINLHKNLNVIIVGIKRVNGYLETNLSRTKLRAGDMLVFSTKKSFKKDRVFGKNFYLINDDITPHNILAGWREKITILGFVAMIGYAVASGDSLFRASFLLLFLLLVTNCLTISDIRDSLPVKIWVIVTASLCIASSMGNTGLTQSVVNFSANYLDGFGPYVVFTGIFILTMFLTELITNNAAVAVMFPVSMSLAQGLGINSYTVAIGIAFAASASFLTPYGYQTNLMVFNATSYRWRDFLVTGIPLSIVYILICIIVIPIVYPF